MISATGEYPPVGKNNVSGLNETACCEPGMSVVSSEFCESRSEAILGPSACILSIDCVDVIYSQGECSFIGFEPAGGAGRPSPGRKRQSWWPKDRALATGDESCSLQTARIARRSVTGEDRRARAKFPASSCAVAPCPGGARMRPRHICHRLARPC